MRSRRKSARWPMSHSPPELNNDRSQRRSDAAMRLGCGALVGLFAGVVAVVGFLFLVGNSRGRMLGILVGSIIH
jgi:hypothetical protein